MTSRKRPCQRLRQVLTEVLTDQMLPPSLLFLIFSPAGSTVIAIESNLLESKEPFDPLLEKRISRVYNAVNVEGEIAGPSC